MGDRVYEFVHVFEVRPTALTSMNPWRVRVWAPCGSNFSQKERAHWREFFINRAHEYVEKHFPATPGELATEIASYVDRVNAVEVTDEEGQGHLVYNDWP